VRDDIELLAIFSDVRVVSVAIDGGRAVKALAFTFKIDSLVSLLITASGNTVA